MASYHNNKLNVVGLFDSDDTYDSQEVNYGFGSRSVGPERFIDGPSGSQHQKHKDETGFKAEESMSPVSYTPSHDSDYYESAGEDISPHKAPKLNKDGAPRKPRQPRPKLLKWTDNDWKNVVLGIIWACGEKGVQIPFSQAAQLVGENCTASALQQAILKLRCKQIAEGHHIPVLKMAWTRKNRSSRPSTPIANTKNAQVQAKTPAWKRALSKVKGSLVVKLKVGHRGIKGMLSKTCFLPTNDMQSKTHVSPMNDMQLETSMLSMNGMNSMGSEAHMLSTNNMLSTNDMLPANNMLPTDNMLSGDLTTPVNDLFSDMSDQTHLAQAYQSFYQDYLQGTQPVQIASPEEKRYNRNHFVAKNGMFNEHNELVATVDDLRFIGDPMAFIQDMMAPEKVLSLGEDVTDLQGHPAMLSKEDLSDLYNQEHDPHSQSAISDEMHGLGDVQGQDHELQGQSGIFNDVYGDSIDWSSYTDHQAHLAGFDDYGPQDDVFKTEF